jgi:hypothetical protein
VEDRGGMLELALKTYDRSFAVRQHWICKQGYSALRQLLSQESAVFDELAQVFLAAPGERISNHCACDDARYGAIRKASAFRENDVLEHDCSSDLH